MWTQIPLGSSHLCHHFSQEPVWAFCPLGHWAGEAVAGLVTDFVTADCSI